MRWIERRAETACRELDSGDFLILIIRNEAAECPRAGYLGKRRQAFGYGIGFVERFRQHVGIVAPGLRISLLCVPKTLSALMR